MQHAVEMEAELAGEPGGAERIEAIKAAERHLAAVEKWVSIELDENARWPDIRDAMNEMEKQAGLMLDAKRVVWETRKLAEARKMIGLLQRGERNSIGEDDRAAVAKALKAAEAWAAASELFLDIMRRKKERGITGYSEEASAASLKAGEAQLAAY